MDFEKLSKTDVTKHIEKKGKFSYLSWPYAVAEFRKSCPDGFWEVGRSITGKPYFKTDLGYFVSVTVTPEATAEYLKFEQIHPVLDNYNKPIKNPTTFQINTSIQRCLVKAIALATGIGLHIYAGEDLPDTGNGNTFITDDQLRTIDKLIQEYKVDTKMFLTYMEVAALDEIPANQFQKAVTSIKAKKK